MKEIPKRYDFISRENYWKNYWQENEIYKFEKNSDKEIYSVDTPPPYVSADHLHVGHIMSYSQAEFIVRYKRMRGYNVYYPMGFDDNGLPTERFVEKKYDINKTPTPNLSLVWRGIKRSEFVDLCLKETKAGAENYKKLWTDMGISTDWTKTYSTIDKNSRYISQKSFIDLYNKKKISRRDEPTFWCSACKCALAQTDLEDKKSRGYLNYINFSSQFGDLTIATSRVEMLASCVGLFVNPDDDRYSELIGKKAKVPLFDYEVEIYSDESVDPDFGTGIMMVCSWGDKEDIAKWRKYKLDTRAIIQKDNTLNKLAGKYSGLDLYKARKMILTDLQEAGFLQKREQIDHTLNIHERCSTVVEFVKTKGWFIDILNEKEKFLEMGNSMNWYPKNQKNKYEDWIKGLNWDWCISRDRFYGVPIPAWYCKDCGEILLPEISDLPIDPTESKPKNKKCSKCSGNKFTGESAVLDTWMTSSVSTQIASKLLEDIGEKEIKQFSLRPQAFEIIRSWLFYSVVKSYYHNDSKPFSDIMISGHGLDKKGIKISKRLGNYKNPNEIIRQYSADALRYWAAGAHLGENIRYNEDEIRKGSRTITKLWNASKFCFMFDPHPSPLLKEREYKDFEDIDKWILDKLNTTIYESSKYFDKYEYSKSKKIIDTFFWNDFCDYYLELVKYRLYEEENSQIVKQVLFKVLESVLKLYAPILPFITEEIWNLYYKDFSDEISIHLTSWPEIDNNFIFLEKDKNEFENVILEIGEIRKYKTERKLSIGKEIDEYKLQNKINTKYGEFLKRSCRVGNLL